MDDGKSTLIGRMLYDSQKIFEDQLTSLIKDSKKQGTQNGKMDLALLVDGLQSEREQGITIDVAYRYFYTNHKKYIIADTPGHEQYTRNMATGASTANLAIILIDARMGVLTQSKRHSYIVTLLGIKNLVIAINKMDLVNYSKEKFDSIKKDYQSFLEKLPNYKNLNVTYIPISALNGDNVVNLSSNTTWWKGKTLLQFLDELPIQQDKNTNFRFPVQYVNRPNLDFRGFCGNITDGMIEVGDEIKILPSNKTTKVKSIISPHFINPNNANLQDAKVQKANAPMSVTLILEDEIDISRGDIIIKKDDDVKMSNNFEATLVWLSETNMQINKNYIIKCATTQANVKIEQILYKKDINTLENLQADSLNLNDIASCKLTLERKILCDIYEQYKQTGSFIIIDRISNETIAAGMITKANKTTQKQTKKYTKEDIELNRYIRKKFPEWKCLSIDEVFKD